VADAVCQSTLHEEEHLYDRIDRAFRAPSDPPSGGD
jgi:hypothetical protein